MDIRVSCARYISCDEIAVTLRAIQRLPERRNAVIHSARWYCSSEQCFRPWKGSTRVIGAYSPIVFFSISLTNICFGFVRNNYSLVCPEWRRDGKFNHGHERPERGYQNVVLLISSGR
jgi:hypothetical protein